MGFFSFNTFLAMACIVALTLYETKAEISDAKAEDFLVRFGYAQPPKAGEKIAAADLTDAVISFQRFQRISITGELDNATKNKMEEPRCGNPDILGKEIANGFAFQRYAWKKTSLTYKVTFYTPDISTAAVDREIAAAAKFWADVSGLDFSEASGDEWPDIEIKFGVGDHGDESPFDGPGGVLAHAFYPSPSLPELGGDAHFDDSEVWSVTSGRGTVNLRLVAVHEFGHSLGLSHSDVEGAVMGPYHDPAITKLHSDDIQRIQELYGPPPTTTEPTEIPETTSPTTSTATTIRDRFLLHGYFFSFLYIIGLASAWLSFMTCE